MRQMKCLSMVIVFSVLLLAFLVNLAGSKSFLFEAFQAHGFIKVVPVVSDPFAVCSMVKNDLERDRFILRLHSIVRLLKIPQLSLYVNDYERLKLHKTLLIKSELLHCIQNFSQSSCRTKSQSRTFSRTTTLSQRISRSRGGCDRTTFSKEFNLDLIGRIGTMLATAASVRHLWGGSLPWLRFRVNCEAAQAFAKRINKLNVLVVKEKILSKDNSKIN